MATIFHFKKRERVKGLAAAVRRRIRRMQRATWIREPGWIGWCFFCDVRLSSTDIWARKCTNCGRPVVFKTKRALKKAIEASLQEREGSGE